MSAKTVGTTVVGQESKPSKWHCHCMLEDGKEVYIMIKAKTPAEASEKAHEGYAVEYVLDILTYEEMERKKRHLKPAIAGGVSTY